MLLPHALKKKTLLGCHSSETYSYSAVRFTVDRSKEQSILSHGCLAELTR